MAEDLVSAVMCPQCTLFSFNHHNSPNSFQGFFLKAFQLPASQVLSALLPCCTICQMTTVFCSQEWNKSICLEGLSLRISPDTQTDAPQCNAQPLQSQPTPVSFVRLSSLLISRNRSFQNCSQTAVGSIGQKGCEKQI